MHDILPTSMNAVRKAPSSRSSQEKDAPGLTIDYQQIGRLCLRYWKWLAGAVVLGAVGGLLVALSQTKIYEAQSTLEVAPNRQSTEMPSAGLLATDRSDNMLKTIEQLLQRRDLPARVVRDEHLNENQEFLPAGVAAPVSEDYATAVLNGMIDIRIRPLTRLIDITVQHPSPTMAKSLADALAREAVLQAADQGSTGASDLADSFQKEVDGLSAKVVEASNKLIEYQKTHHVSNAIGDPTGDLANTEVKDLHQRYDDALATYALLSERYGPNHPKLIQAKEAVEELHAQLVKSTGNALNQDSESVEYENLKSTADSLKAQLASMQKALQDARTAVTLVDPGINVAGPAALPLVPVWPSKTKDAAIGGFLGALGGACFILGLYFLDSSIRTVSQAENTLGVPVIAAIPILPETENRSKLPTFSDAQSFVAEAFRGLRASLLLHDRDNPLKIVLVGSAIPGEGKSFCASNLAVVFAQAGLKTLLIDADLRLPTGADYFGITQNEATQGFPAVLLGKASLDSAVIRSEVPNLNLLMTTTAADAPAELLSGPRLHQLLDECAKKYDRVVLDSAPLNAVSDTMLIVQKADAILLVVRAGTTPASESKAALHKIYGSKMKPLGLILNYLAPHTLKSYSYGYSYGQKPPKNKNAK
jgi:succinoglycan biosynthesis transport protein ExoP